MTEVLEGYIKSDVRQNLTHLKVLRSHRSMKRCLEVIKWILRCH